MSMDCGPSYRFAEGKLRLVTSGRRQIGIVRWAGKLYAVNNYCSHQGGPICMGLLSGRLGSDGTGSMTLDTSSPVLACPWHGWEFDLRTGSALADPATKIRTFNVREADGRVVVD